MNKSTFTLLPDGFKSSIKDILQFAAIGGCSHYLHLFAVGAGAEPFVREHVTLYLYLRAYAINSSGKIVGIGLKDGVQKAFLLTPNP